MRCSAFYNAIWVDEIIKWSAIDKQNQYHPYH